MTRRVVAWCGAASCYAVLCGAAMSSLTAPLGAQGLILTERNVSLKLAQTLGVTVEDLFYLP